MFASEPFASVPLAGQGAAEVVADPTADNTTGTYVDSGDVVLSCTTDGASIYYTTDGSTPDSGDTLYSSAITISTTTTLKFIGIKAGATDSAVVTETYTITVGGVGKGTGTGSPGAVTEPTLVVNTSRRFTKFGNRRKDKWLKKDD